MVNKIIGNEFEADFCDLLFENGFWAHNMAQSQAGQPADVIAARHGISYLIDCKVCCNNKFALSRIEENQESAMSLWENCGNTSGLFALRLPSDGSIFMLTLGELLSLRALGVKSLSEHEIRNALSFAEWVGDCP